MASKNKTKPSGNNFTRFLISIIFIALGTSSVVGVLQDLLTLDLNIGIAAALGILMFITGITSLCGKMVACRILGVVICILSCIMLVMTIPTCTLSTLQAPALYLTQALLAWLFFGLS